MFIHTKQVREYDLSTEEGASGRFYITPSNNKYPSITTVLGDGDKQWLNDWRDSIGHEQADALTQAAAARGTAVHDMIERHLNNEETPTAGHIPEHIKDFTQVKLHLKRINNIITQEAALWSDVFKVAGRVDCIGEFDGQLSVIDFKTSTNNKTSSMIEDYYLQTTAYALMFHEMYDIKIDNLVIIMASNKGGIPLVFKKTINEQYISALLMRTHAYRKKHNLQ